MPAGCIESGKAALASAEAGEHASHMPSEATIDSDGEQLNRGKDPVVSRVSSFARSSVESAAERISAASTFEQIDAQIVVLSFAAYSIVDAIERAYLEIAPDRSAA